jgi:uncharacterized RDD family membrane protein YckC
MAPRAHATYRPSEVDNMSETYANSYALPRRDALTGVRTRRLTALCFDFIVVSVIASVIYVLLLVLTLGLSFFFLPPLWPIVAFFYNGVSMSGRNRGTPGMRAAGLEVRMRDSGAPVPFLNAAAHGAFFYISWFFPLVFLVTLVDSEKRFLHDILSGVIVLRRG